MSSSRKDTEYRQILTKAVCGRGKRFSQTEHSIKAPENVYSVLGAWVINHNYKCQNEGDAVVVSGSYDLNIWYSTEENTKTEVMKETVYYRENIPLSYCDSQALNNKVNVRAVALQPPSCLEAAIASGGSQVVVKIEKELMVEVIGETKVCVPVYPLAAAQYEDDDEKCSSFTHESSSSSSSSSSGFEGLDPELLDDGEDF
ncbi:MAG: hypothetical protein RLZ12_282 [Bacillota bacterium]|jgi:spore coat protein E